MGSGGTFRRPQGASAVLSRGYVNGPCVVTGGGRPPLLQGVAVGEILCCTPEAAVAVGRHQRHLAPHPVGTVTPRHTHVTGRLENLVASTREGACGDSSRCGRAARADLVGPRPLSEGALARP